MTRGEANLPCWLFCTTSLRSGPEPADAVLLRGLRLPRMGVTVAVESREHMDLTIIATDDELDIEMVNTQPSEPVAIGDGVTVTWQVPMFKSAGIPKMIDVAVQILEAVPAGVAASIITGWLISRFKGRAEKVVVKHQEVEFEEGKLTRIVYDTITRERGE